MSSDVPDCNTSCQQIHLPTLRPDSDSAAQTLDAKADHATRRRRRSKHCSLYDSFAVRMGKPKIFLRISIGPFLPIFCFIILKVNLYVQFIVCMCNPVWKGHPPK